jgi:hypothetical protein
MVSGGKVRQPAFTLAVSSEVESECRCTEVAARSICTLNIAAAIASETMDEEQVLLGLTVRQEDMSSQRTTVGEEGHLFRQICHSGILPQVYSFRFGRYSPPRWVRTDPSSWLAGHLVTLYS